MKHSLQGVVGDKLAQMINDLMIAHPEKLQDFGDGKQRGHVKSFVRSLTHQEDPAEVNALLPPKHRRYVQNPNYDARIKASKDYVATLREDNYRYLFSKPYDFTAGNAAYYSLMYNILNLLQAMRIRPGGRVLEVGSGPGWVTEILISQGYQVDAMEPSEDFIKIAEERVRSHIKHYHLEDQRGAMFHCTTTEECNFPDESFDAILFFDVLHHIVDEEKSLAQCFRFLTPGGVLGIHEGAWNPSNKELERWLDAEMKSSGCLESPFTVEYLDYLLRKVGFIQATRFHQINGLFPQSQEGLTISQAAQIKAELANIITALKPFTHKTTKDLDANVSGKILVLSREISQGKLKLKLKLENCGDAVWLDRASGSGWVSIALRDGDPGTREFKELPRLPLPRALRPGDCLEIELEYPDPGPGSWTLDLVNEGFYWFSKKGVIEIAR